MTAKSYTKTIVLFIAVLVLLTSLTGCSDSQVTGSNYGGQGRTGSDVYPVTVTDVLGREVTVAREPERIVSLSPAVTEILFTLNLDEKIVGVTDYCDYPAAALDKPKVGGFANPNMEVIINLEPDLVFTSAGVQEDILHQLEKVGITAVVLDAEDIEGVLNNIKLAGKITGSGEKAAEVVSNLQKRIDNVAEKISKTNTRPSVFFEVWDDPLMSAGPGSFIDDLIKRAGGRNIAGDARERYPKFNLEVLLAENPDIYIINSHAHKPEDIKARDGYASLRAVQHDRVYSIEDDLVTLPGPRIVTGLEEMARIIHPEVF